VTPPGVFSGTSGGGLELFLVKIVTGATTHRRPIRYRWGHRVSFSILLLGSADGRFNSITTSNLPRGSTYGYQIGLNDGSSITFQFAVR